MASKILTAAIVGLDAQLVEVEADISGGFPRMFIVGLPDASVQEAKERVRSAIKNSDIEFPRSVVTVNLAPADLKKEGPSYDLPIALAVLVARGKIKPDVFTQEKLFVGELALNGSVRNINGILSIALMARAQGIRELFLPAGNAKEASIINGIDIYPLDHLRELVFHLRGHAKFSQYVRTKEISSPPELSYPFDMKYIRGQEHAKRALEIAAAGGHNVLMTGPPGSGKTMLAKALPSILPRLSLEEAVDVTRVYSVAGLLPSDEPLMRTRPFRSPHHTASAVAIIGGGSWPKPGEISLAHRGVLFLDEFSEFQRPVLESLRQPLEDGIVTVSRISGTLQFPSRFILIAAQNPCPCGYSTDPVKQCTCAPSQIVKYRKKISGPLLDRIDLHIEVPRVAYDKLSSELDGEPSRLIRERVEQARVVQVRRLRSFGVKTNTEMSLPHIKSCCTLDGKTHELLKNAVNMMHLSARSYQRILKVSRTIADLAGSDNIDIQHVAEALQYREKTL